MSYEQDSEALLSSGDVAHLAKVSPQTVRNWVDAGKLTPSKRTVRGERLFTRADVERFLEERGR